MSELSECVAQFIVVEWSEREQDRRGRQFPMCNGCPSRIGYRRDEDFRNLAAVVTSEREWKPRRELISNDSKSIREHTPL